MQKKWSELHEKAEKLACDAEVIGRSGDSEAARHLYRQAAAAETEAFHAIPSGLPRTLGVTAVSAVSLWEKAGNSVRATEVAKTAMAMDALPASARRELEIPYGSRT